MAVVGFAQLTSEAFPPPRHSYRLGPCIDGGPAATNSGVFALKLPVSAAGGPHLAWNAPSLTRLNAAAAASALVDSLVAAQLGGQISALCQRNRKWLPACLDGRLTGCSPVRALVAVGKLPPKKRAAASVHLHPSHTASGALALAVWGWRKK